MTYGEISMNPRAALTIVLLMLAMFMLGFCTGILVMRPNPPQQTPVLFPEQKIDRFLQGKPVSYEQPSNAQLMHFAAVCRVSQENSATEVHPCRLDDLSAPGYWNRWAITLSTRLRPQPRTAMWVYEGLTNNGSLMHNMLLWGTVDVQPEDPQLVQYFKSRFAAPGRHAETRPQNLTVATLHGQTILLIDEPIFETDGVYTPSISWTQRWFEALGELLTYKRLIAPVAPMEVHA